MTERSAFLIGAYGVNTGSDLEAAYELARHFPSVIDFRIWHERPGIDAILNLLHRSDGE